MSVPVVVSLSGNTFLQLRAGHIGRKFPWGSSWNSLRVVVRCCVTSIAEDVVDLPWWFIGAASGADQWIGDNPTRHCVGAAPTVGFLDYTSATRAAYLMGATVATKARKRIVTTDTDNATSISTTAGYISADPAYRSVMAVELTRSGGNVNVNFAILSTNDLYDVPQAWMREVCSTPTFYAPPTGTMALGTARALAVDEATYGYLDHLCIYWDRASISLNISDIVIGKLA